MSFHGWGIRMAEERRRRKRIVSKELLEYEVIAMNELGVFIGNVFDISECGVGILTEIESSKNQEIGFRISGTISGPFFEEIPFSGTIARKDEVITSNGIKRILGINFFEMIQLSERLLALSLTAKS